MKTLKIIMPVLIAITMSTFTACSSSSSSSDDTKIDTKSSYIINETENRDIPLDAEMLAQSEGTKVKITRNVESDTAMNVHVIEGSVEVTEIE